MSYPHCRINRQRTAFPARLVLGAVALLGAIGVSAQTQYSIYVEPMFLYNWQYGNNPPTPFRTTLAAAWADVQAQPPGCAPETCSWINLQPNTTSYTFDGIYYLNVFNEQECYEGTCTTEGQSDILTSMTCPQGFVNGDYNYNSGTMNYLYACSKTIRAGNQANMKYCLSCISDPIIASTGQELQAETDYSGASGLDFRRTYLSNIGYFSSVVTQAFVDNSTPAAEHVNGLETHLFTSLTSNWV